MVYMVGATYLTAVEKLAELNDSESWQIVVDDGGEDMTLDNLLEVCRNNTEYDCESDYIIECNAIYKANIDGFRESIPVLSVKKVEQNQED